MDKDPENIVECGMRIAESLEGLDREGFDKSGAEAPHSGTLARSTGRGSWGYQLVGRTYRLEKENQNLLTSIPTEVKGTLPTNLEENG